MTAASVWCGFIPGPMHLSKPSVTVCVVVSCVASSGDLACAMWFGVLLCLCELCELFGFGGRIRHGAASVPVQTCCSSGRAYSSAVVTMRMD